MVLKKTIVHNDAEIELQAINNGGAVVVLAVVVVPDIVDGVVRKEVLMIKNLANAKNVGCKQGEREGESKEIQPEDNLDMARVRKNSNGGMIYHEARRELWLLAELWLPVESIEPRMGHCGNIQLGASLKYEIKARG